MAGDEVDFGEGLFEELRRGLRDELVRGAVEAVLADPHLLVVLRIDRVHSRAVGHRRDVEGRVEDADVRDALEDLLARLDAAEVRRHVERPELDELLRLRHVRLVHERGVLEDLAAVENAVSDCVNALRHVAEIRDDLGERGRVVLGTAAADAFDETLRETGFRLHVEELVLERTRARVDYEYFSDCLFHVFS